jgi:hypothetical protein
MLILSTTIYCVEKYIIGILIISNIHWVEISTAGITVVCIVLYFDRLE